MAIWRSADDIIVSACRNGNTLPTHIVQLIGILPNGKCSYDRVGHVWTNPLCMRQLAEPSA
eukprot:9493481-Pyramimonas_sp.AAC.1